MCVNFICKVDVDKNIGICEFRVKLHELLLDIAFGSFRELYYLLLFDIVSFPSCMIVFVWSEHRPQSIDWSVLVTKKFTFGHVCT